MRSLAAALWLLLLLPAPSVVAVKEQDFKKCHESSFCRRGRALADRATEHVKSGEKWKSPYSLDASTIVLEDGGSRFTGRVRSSLYPEIKFELDVRVHEDGVVRVRMDEKEGLRKRYDEAASWALLKEPVLSPSSKWSVGKKEVKVVYGAKKDQVEVTVEFEPLVVRMKRNGKDQVVLNGQGLLHMEHFKKKVEKVEAEVPVVEGEETQKVVQLPPNSWFEGVTEDGWWEETWKTWTDTKPKGPESLSLDINFPNHGHVYGIPQHATHLDLPTTKGEGASFNDPYRLYNGDIFEYPASSSSLSLYGSIPIIHAHSADSTVAVFVAVASETWVDVAHPTQKSTETHWISESGILDIFLLPGPTPDQVFGQYARLTGAVQLPPHWSLAYHQCRWNYVSSDDIRGVQKRFDEEDIPVDVFWLDIEYSEEHKYMIWEKKYFPDPIDMLNDVAALARKMVIIVDPHIKRTVDYPVYKEGQELDLFVKNKQGNEFEGWCWSGSSAWIDFFNPNSWEWYKQLYKFNGREDGKWSWTESTSTVHIWNDMNEPAIFNGPEITMEKDSIHYGGWEHRDVHNINGMLFANTTSQAVKERTTPYNRPFVLTRSYYAGAQRFAAMWTGDNMGTWEHMAVGIPMVLSNSISGMSFTGADVGGFFGNPEPEMLTRWYFVGAFSPFFRAHAHIDTKRREPYLLAEPYKSIVREIIRLRYSLLPVWYTAFRESSVTGLPVTRPQYVVLPKNEAGFSIDDQYYVGASGLLVKPITEAGITETTVHIGEDQVYYDFYTGHAYRGSVKGKSVTVPAPLERGPLLIRGGSILPSRDRPRRSSALMKRDPFTLKVALSQSGNASGELYLDDGESYDHREGNFIWREFVAESTKKTVTISSKDLASRNPDSAVDGVELAIYNGGNAFANALDGVRVERIVVLGLKNKPTKVTLGKAHLEFTFKDGMAAAGNKEGVASKLTVKNPGAFITSDWSIVLEL
ncbi:alpha-glucosidase [Thelephora terrestris]|uniref:Glucosidase II subunit alpha n=1 Tax=Thelephora terrestris TaxID=56493 RepID=A0A9P6HCG1_9AGAM|nr:alpha-glucosidase [Thelephora terrestris]